MGGYVPNLPLNMRDPYRQLSKRSASEPLNEKDILSMLPNQGQNMCDPAACHLITALNGNCEMQQAT